MELKAQFAEDIFKGVTEALKDFDQMLWVHGMIQICERAKEITNAELIYV